MPGRFYRMHVQSVYREELQSILRHGLAMFIQKLDDEVYIYKVNYCKEQVVLFPGLFLAFAFGLDLYSNVTKAGKSLRTWQYISVPGNSKKKSNTQND